MFVRRNVLLVDLQGQNTGRGVHFNLFLSYVLPDVDSNGSSIPDFVHRAQQKGHFGSKNINIQKKNV